MAHGRLKEQPFESFIAASSLHCHYNGIAAV
jgi:hypothetical protein